MTDTDQIVWTELSLEDYFAAQAMQAIVAWTFRCGPHQDSPSYEVIARWAYLQANAMIEEKKRRGKL